MIMGSQRFDRGIAKMNGCDRDNNAGEKIDLTLKLGLPAETDENENSKSLGIGQMQNLDFDQMAPPFHANLDIDGLYSHEGINHNKLKNIANVGQRFNANEVAWTPLKLGSQYSHHASAQNLHPSSNNGYNFSPFPGSSMGSIPLHTNRNPSYHHQYQYNNINFNIKPNNNMLGAMATMNDYTLLDVPSRRVDREVGINIGSSSSSSSSAAAAADASALPRRRAAAGGGMRRQRGGGFVDPFKRCTNYNCNTNDTPMWRKGPLGPKTLCNACGIKYRKEEEKRKAKAAATSTDKSNSEDSSTPTGSRN